MTDKNYMKRRFKCRCYQKDNTVKIYDGSEILFDVSYRDFDDAFYLGRKLQSVIMELNELHEENDVLKQELKTKVVVNRQYEELQTLKKENEQLKTTISNYMDCIDKLYIENERLKRKLEFEEYKNRSYNKE